MKKEEWFGIDSSLAISLFEYGLLVCKNWQCDAPDGWFCLVGTKTDDGGCFTHFDHGYIREHELETETWINWDEFLSFCGTTKEVWMLENFVNKFHDLIQYYGPLNFGFGTNYEFEIKEEELDSYIENMQGK
jgi:hypothetical protein